MSKILDDAYKALNWMGTNMRPVCINDMDTGYKMELAVKAALDEPVSYTHLTLPTN